jgi:peptidyl-prolyl cis-trans isomerase C
MTLADPRRALAFAAALAAAPLALNAQDQNTGDARPAAEAAAPTADTVLAVVNGDEITLGEIVLMRANLPQQYQSLPPRQLMPALVDQAVTARLLADRGRREGYGDTALARLRLELAERNYLSERVMQDIVGEAATEEKLREMYDERLAALEPEQEVRASHILVEEKAEAEEILAELEQGAAFAELAAERSTGPSAESGGDLGWFGEGRMVPAFSEAAFGAEVDAVVGPVETQFGWHVIQVTGKRQKPMPSFEEMRQELAREAGAQAVEAAVEAARAAADVTIVDTEIDPAAIRRDDLLTGE